MWKRFALLSTLMVTAMLVLAQTTAKTEKGKNVILHDNGTWEFAEENEQSSEEAIVDSSECSHWIKTTVDKVDGTSWTSGKEVIIVSEDGTDGFAILLMQATRGGLTMRIKAVGAGSCIDEGDAINILFRDGSRLKLANDASFNCKGNSTVYFGGVFKKKKQLKELQEKQIETMRVWTSDLYVEEDFKSEQSIIFRNQIRCLTH